MLDLFRRKGLAPSSQVNFSLVRSHARTLIRLANVADTAGFRINGQGATTASSSREWQAMTSCEVQLATSIAAAVSGNVSMHYIVDHVIRPILKEAIVLSETADDAVTRAVTAAKRA